MADITSYFNDPMDPARSLQLNNRYWPGETFQHLDALRAADDDIKAKRYGSLKKSLKPVLALLPKEYHRAFLARLAYSITYRIVFEPIRFAIKLSDEFIDANSYKGDKNEAYMEGRNVEELRHVVGMAHTAYQEYYGRDILSSGFQVRYINSTNTQRVEEITGHGAFSDFHLDQRSEFTCIVYLTNVGTRNGCFSYLDGSSTVQKSHLLRALHGVVSFEMGLPNPEQTAHLPLELRGGIGLGNFLDDDKHSRLAGAKIDVVGPPGSGVIFNGFDTIHRGGKPIEGERLAIFVSTGGRLTMRLRRYSRQMLASLWV
jgi:hypothetical protein